MSQATYRIALLGHKQRCAEVRETISHRVRALGLLDQVELDFEGAPSPDVPSVVVAAWTPEVPAEAFEGLVEAAVGAGVLVVPVVDSTSAMPDDLPGHLERLNALGWDTAGSSGVADVCLRELGLHEGERRVFISHRRSDGLQAAADLHAAMREHGWTPFIDRFAIPAGGDVREAIEHALEDMAFLLLLETPEAHTSEWVDLEVLYATGNSMGVLVVNIADAPAIPAAADFPRLTIGSDEVTWDGSQIVLGDEVIQRILGRAERDHQLALARRRRVLLLSSRASATRAGKQVELAPSWRLRVSGTDGSRQLVDHLPRIPSVEDLHRLNVALMEGEAGLAPMFHPAGVE